jgi:CspA family cold shock protein
MPTGCVKWFNSQIGYGFIQPDGGGREVLVHSGLDSLTEGAWLSYELVNRLGKQSAHRLVCNNARPQLRNPEGHSTSIAEAVTR